jgi:aminopeptidase YwaD
VGLVVDALPFSALAWIPGPVGLEHHGTQIALPPSPFSPSGRVSGIVRRVSRRADLERLAAAAPAEAPIVVLDGELAAERFFPRAFPFVSIPEQLAILDLLGRCRPAAVLAVVPPDRRADVDPVFEDPDLGWAYVTLPRNVGDRLRDGDRVRVDVQGSLVRGDGANISGRRSAADATRVVLSAHLDSKATTPGALDNGAGVAMVLALAEAARPHIAGVEYVFFNGEDHYAAPGEQAWLAARDIEPIRLVVNVDGPGLGGYGVSVAALALPDDDTAAVNGWIAERPPLEPGPPWFESDHAIFAMQGIPSLAVTSAAPHRLLAELSHSSQSRLEDLDLDVLARAALRLAEVVELLAGHLGIDAEN